MNNSTPTSPEGPDTLDELLREAEPHIPDAGFTTRVLAALPPRRRLDPLRLAFFAAAWLAGVVVLLLHGPTVGGAVAAVLQHGRQGELAPLVILAAVVLALGSLVWTLTSWALEEWT